MEKFEYMRLCIEIIPKEIILKYYLCELVDDQGWVYIKIQMDMYGLPQAGILANKLLEKRLNKKRYYQCQHTPGLWWHVWRDITFCLVVDDFGIKTTSKEHMIYLQATLEKHYTLAIDWTGSLSCRIDINWD